VTSDELTPEEFARLLALPEDHPDRRRWRGSALFESRLRLHDRFVAGDASSLDAASRASAERELGVRLEHALAGERPPREPGHGERARERVLDLRTGDPRSRRGPDRSTGRSRAHMRSAILALAAGLVVVATATWIVTRPAERRVVRSAATAERLVLAEPHVSGGVLDLAWTAVPEADRYEVVFYGADLNEITRVKDLAAARLELRPDALPAGLARGQEVLAGVIATRAGDTIATSKTRAVRIP